MGQWHFWSGVQWWWLCTKTLLRGTHTHISFIKTTLDLVWRVCEMGHKPLAQQHATGDGVVRCVCGTTPVTESWIVKRRLTGAESQWGPRERTFSRWWSRTPWRRGWWSLPRPPPQWWWPGSAHSTPLWLRDDRNAQVNIRTGGTMYRTEQWVVIRNDVCCFYWSTVYRERKYSVCARDYCLWCSFINQEWHVSAQQKTGKTIN